MIADGAVDYGPISYPATGKPFVETFSLQEPGSYEIRLNGTADKNGKCTIGSRRQRLHRLHPCPSRRNGPC